jgi:hypothetical protein
MKSLLRLVFGKTIVRIINYILHNISNDFIYKTNLSKLLWERALISSADYVEKSLNNAMVFPSKEQLWDYTINMTQGCKNCLEFGVFQGNSINYFSAKCPERTFFGFDSFEGLAEDWAGHYSPKGTFDTGGSLPKVNSNVILIKGWFNETLPKFLEREVSIDFIHIDSDTYPAAVIILELLKDKIFPGMYILFDDYLGYPNYQNGEMKAWKEFTEKYGLQYIYKGFSDEQALVLVVQ